jgi:hypothetical protein
LQKYRQILAHSSVPLLRILRARRLLLNAGYTERFLFKIHLLLDSPWDELAATICPLRSVIGRDVESLRELLICASDPTVFPEPFNNPPLRDLVHNCIYIIKKILSHELPLHFRQVLFNITDASRIIDTLLGGTRPIGVTF